MKGMKIVVMLLAVLGVLVLLGWLFIRWANKPENVEALLKERAEEKAAQERADSVKAAEASQRVTKGGEMRLVLEEVFGPGGPKVLQGWPKEHSAFKVEDGKLKFNTLLTQGGNSYDYFLLTPEEYGDFKLEMDMSIWGSVGRVGAVWAATGVEPGKRPLHHQAAYSAPLMLFVDTDKTHRHSLGAISAVNRQHLEVDRIGRWVQVSVNGEVRHTQEDASSEPGRVGIYIGHFSPEAPTESVSITVESFRLEAR